MVKFFEQELAEIEKQVADKSMSYDYRTKDYPLEVIRNKFGEENDPKATLYVPNYQRKFVWKNDRRSRFVESVLLRAPLTPFLVSENEDERLEIIDGSQRIRTLMEFCKNKLTLTKLEVLTHINNFNFLDLPIKLQRSIKNRDFRVIVLSKADITIKQDIFSRINTSSEQLTPSEIRKGS